MSNFERVEQEKNGFDNDFVIGEYRRHELEIVKEKKQSKVLNEYDDEKIVSRMLTSGIHREGVKYAIAECSQVAKQHLKKFGTALKDYANNLVSAVEQTIKAYAALDKKIGTWTIDAMDNLNKKMGYTSTRELTIEQFQRRELAVKTYREMLQSSVQRKLDVGRKIDYFETEEYIALIMLKSNPNKFTEDEVKYAIEIGSPAAMVPWAHERELNGSYSEAIINDANEQHEHYEKMHRQYLYEDFKTNSNFKESEIDAKFASEMLKEKIPSSTIIKSLAENSLNVSRRSDLARRDAQKIVKEAEKAVMVRSVSKNNAQSL